MDDLCCDTIARCSLRMVYNIGDAYWVSRRLDNATSSHARAVWIINSYKKIICNVAANDKRQADCLVVC